MHHCAGARQHGKVFMWELRAEEEQHHFFQSTHKVTSAQPCYETIC